jgi:hypothetical protein
MLSNPFKEVQGDKSVYRKLLLGFTCVIVLSVLLFSIALTVSPNLRHDIGIGNNAPVGRTHPSAHRPVEAHHPSHKTDQENGQHNEGVISGKKDHRHKRADVQKGNTHQGKGNHESPPESPTGPPKPPVETKHEHESTPTPEPTLPAPTHPSGESKPPASGGGTTIEESNPGDGGGGVTTNPVRPPTVSKPPRVEVEVKIPPITEAPVVAEVTGAVNETINGVTSTVEGTVSGAGLPIHVEVPEVCLINCH